jgi:hypothetical protein
MYDSVQYGGVKIECKIVYRMQVWRKNVKSVHYLTLYPYSSILYTIIHYIPTLPYCTLSYILFLPFNTVHYHTFYPYSSMEE